MKSGTLIMVGLAIFASFILGVALPISTSGQSQGTKSLNDIYADESHCLTLPEIRNEKDSPISCYCRDAIVDARYVWHTYLTTAKDSNLNGTELTLQINAKHMCGENYDVAKAVRADWKWNGPEVVRTYPPDDVLRQIKPDSHGMIHYDYTVVLLHRDSSGGVARTESYTASEMEPIDSVLKRSSPKSRE